MSACLGVLIVFVKGSPHTVAHATGTRLVGTRSNLARTAGRFALSSRVADRDRFASELGAGSETRADEEAIEIDMDDGTTVGSAAGELLAPERRRRAVLLRRNDVLELLLEARDPVKARLSEIAGEEVGRRRRMLGQPVFVFEQRRSALVTLGRRQPRSRDARRLRRRIGRRRQFRKRGLHLLGGSSERFRC